MREILFRGKEVESGEWVRGYFVSLNGNEHRIYNGYAETDCGDYYPDWFKVDPDTVGQFTGLYDKSGQGIYEGDLLDGFQYPFYHEADDTHNYFAEVCWFDRSYAFGIYTHKYPASKVNGISAGNTDLVEEFNSADWVIIGNIHDNPELVKRGAWQ